MIRVPERGVPEPPRDYRTVTELLAEAAEPDLQLRDAARRQLWLGVTGVSRLCSARARVWARR